jgi:aryl-alcohol dehydrogenase-like predicted oxidoreductase
MIADRHSVDEDTVSIANVAVRWVLDQPAVGAVIVGEIHFPNDFLRRFCPAS